MYMHTADFRTETHAMIERHGYVHISCEGFCENDGTVEVRCMNYTGKNTIYCLIL